MSLSYRGWSGRVNNGPRGEEIYVTLSECDNCGWRSGWNPETETQRRQRIHDLQGNCDCRNVPQPDPATTWPTQDAQ